jgi:uncharacterized protein (DUF58 family)
VLSRQGWLLAFGGFVLLVLARLLGIDELYVFGACCLGLVALAVVYVAARRLELEVNRAVHPARVHAGRVSRVDLRVRNLQGVDTPVLRLHEPVTGTPGAELLVPPLSRRSAAVASYRLPTDRRGILTVGPLEVMVNDPFGLARTSLRAAAPVEVTVYPRVEDVRPVPYTATSDPLSGARQPHSLGRTGDDFYALRPYVVGDDMRRVHWPSTARHDEMLVRQQEQPWQGRTTILLDVRRAAHDVATFEAAVSAAASIAVANSMRRDMLRMMTTAGSDTGFGLGHSHLQALLEHLAVVETDGSASLRRSAEALHKVGGGALVVVMGQTIPEELVAVSRLRGRFGSVLLVQVEHGRGSANGNGKGTGGGVARGPAGAVIKVAPGTSFASVWDPMVARQSDVGRSKAPPSANASAGNAHRGTR